MGKVNQVPHPDCVVQPDTIQKVVVGAGNEQGSTLSLVASQFAHIFLGFVELVGFDGAHLEGNE